MNIAGNSIDRGEVERFGRMAARWWDERGPMAPLHKLNPVRVGYIRDQVAAHFGRDPLTLGSLADLRILDIGCGTGCVGITLVLERPRWQVTLVDISPDALALARENAAALGASAELRQADLFAALPGGPYDMIVSNPPYISAGEYDALEPVVRENEPRLALLGGSDGLQHLRALAQRAGESLRPGGILLAEVGWRQSAAVQAIFTEALGNAGAIRDLNGIERVIVSRKG